MYVCTSLSRCTVRHRLHDGTMARWHLFAEGSPPSTDTIMHLVCGLGASICGCCRNATYGCMSCVTRARRINASQPQGNAQMLYSRRDLDARRQNRVESGHDEVKHYRARTCQGRTEVRTCGRVFGAKSPDVRMCSTLVSMYQLLRSLQCMANWQYRPPFFWRF